MPKNNGLKDYVTIGLSYLPKDQRIIEVRGEDVPLWVELSIDRGINATGMTGEDLFNEFLERNKGSNLKVKRKILWDDKNARFRKPTLCFIGRYKEPRKKELTIFISSKYKALADRYLAEMEKDYRIRKIYINGCVEPSCSEGIADYIIDIVYTGSSLKKYGLEVYDKIMQSDFVIIGGKENEIN
ncbi:MAG: hypothetical protein KKE20_06150 [Nanoarchaeota archaeon]|nr:hypothetical protein [Nanoarchaeota archaeon]